MRHDQTLILDMLIAARKIVRFTDQMSRQSFLSNEMAQSAVIREFQVLGEAARLISDDMKARYNEIPWPAITGIRNRIIHEYFSIDLDIVWDTIQTDLPGLLGQLERIASDAGGMSSAP